MYVSWVVRLPTFPIGPICLLLRSIVIVCVVVIVGVVGWTKVKKLGTQVIKFVVRGVQV